MTSSLSPGRRTAYMISSFMVIIGIAGVILRHQLYCGILGLFLAGIGTAWLALLLIRDRTGPRAFRIISLIFHICFSLFLISFIIIETLVIQCAVRSNNAIPEADASYTCILVPGAGLFPSSAEPSLLYRLRLDKAAELYDNDDRLTIVICGGQGDDEIVSEAKAGYDYLIRRGIPADALLAEDASLDTAENLRNFHLLFPEEKNVALVSNDFHIYRCTKLAERYGFEVTSYSMPTPTLILRLNYFVREYVSLAIFAIESQGITIDTANSHI